MDEAGTHFEEPFVFNGLNLATVVGKLLGHRKCATTAIYAHLDDAALGEAAVQASVAIARAMGCTSLLLTVTDEADDETAPKRDPECKHRSKLYLTLRGQRRC